MQKESERAIDANSKGHPNQFCALFAARHPLPREVLIGLVPIDIGLVVSRRIQSSRRSMHSKACPPPYDQGLDALRDSTVTDTNNKRHFQRLDCADVCLLPRQSALYHLALLCMHGT